MKLYVANGTRQTHNFMYRVKGTPGLRSQFIPPGKQLLVNGDLTQEQIDDIIKVNEKYGLVDYHNIDRTKPYIGMCYSIDKPVPPPKIMHVLEHNMDVLSERGQHNREMAAITTNDALEHSAMDGGVGDLKNLEIEIIEESGKGSTNSNPLAEGFRVTRHETSQARVTGRGAQAQQGGGGKQGRRSGRGKGGQG